MASRVIIISEIESAVKDEYSDWKIGITNDPANRKAQLGNPLSWLQWKAASKEVASFVMQHFLSQGLKNAGKKPEP